MARIPPMRSKSRSGVLGAGAAGGGIGTVIASIAASLPPDSVYKSFLTVCAPVVTISISGVLLFVKSVYVDPFVARRSYEANQSYLTTLLADAKRYERDVVADPMATAKHKEEVRKQVEKIEMALMFAISEGAHSVVVRV